MGKPVYLYVTPFFPSPRDWRGGFCYDAVRAIMRSGRYDVRVILYSRKGGVDYEYEGIPVWRIKRYQLPLDIAPFLVAWLNRLVLFRKLISKDVCANDVKICHANVDANYAVAVKKVNNEALAIYQTHQGDSPFNLLTPRIGIIPIYVNFLYLYYRALFECMDVVTLLSKQHVSMFGRSHPDGPLGCDCDMRKDLFLGRLVREIRLKHSYVLYNGIDSEIFEPSGRMSHDGFVIGCIGNFGPYKGQLTLIKAAERLKKTIPGLRVVFVGSGINLDRCKNYVQAHALESMISFEKEIDHTQLPAKYKALDLFVLPSYFEGFCCVLVEAVGCGTPAMTTDQISFKEVLYEEDYSKWLFRPNDDVDLSEKILKYYRERYKFRFNRSLNIDSIWNDFFKFIDTLSTAD